MQRAIFSYNVKNKAHRTKHKYTENETQAPLRKVG